MRLFSGIAGDFDAQLVLFDGGFLQNCGINTSKRLLYKAQNFISILQ